MAVHGPIWPILDMGHPGWPIHHQPLLLVSRGMNRFLESSSRLVFKARWMNYPEISLDNDRKTEISANIWMSFPGFAYESYNLPWWKWNFWSKSPYSCAIFSLSWYLKCRFRIFSFLNRCVFTSGRYDPSWRFLLGIHKLRGVLCHFQVRWKYFYCREVQTHNSIENAYSYRIFSRVIKMVIWDQFSLYWGRH